MAETKTKPINPWREDFVNVFIPKMGDADEDYQFVSINDRTWQIEKNVDVAVPRPVAVLLQQRNTAIRVSERAIKLAQEEFNNPTIIQR